MAIEGNQLYNFIKHAYVPPQILNVDDIVQKLYEDYVTERIKVSLWAPVKKQNNKMHMSSSKKQSVKMRDQTVDLKETKNLYGHLMALTRSNRNIDQKNAVGNYEFTLSPRVLFAPDGSILPCTDKSKLIHNLEQLVNTEEQTETPSANEQDDDCIIICNIVNYCKDYHCRVLVQKMTKKRGIHIVSERSSREFQ